MVVQKTEIHICSDTVFVEKIEDAVHDQVVFYFLILVEESSVVSADAEQSDRGKTVLGESLDRSFRGGVCVFFVRI